MSTSTTIDGPAKRIKLDGDAMMRKDVSPHILESDDAIRQAYLEGQPYPHGRLENVFQPEFLGMFDYDSFRIICHNQKV
jgi:hypothetical protein